MAKTEVNMACKEMIVYVYQYLFRDKGRSKQQLKVCCSHKGHAAFLFHNDGFSYICFLRTKYPFHPSYMEGTEAAAPVGMAFQGKVIGLPLKWPITCRKLSSHKNVH